MNFMKRSAPLCALTLFVLTALLSVDATKLFGFTSSSISLTAYSGDGTNTGIARLGLNVSIVPTVKYATSSTVYWSLQGAGTLSSSGLYTAPDTMPSNPAVTVTATLASDSSVSASYTMYLQNPIPTIRVVYPQQLATATSQAVQVFGNYFVPGSIISVNGYALSTSYVSSGELTANVWVPDSATGSYTFSVYTPQPGGGTTAGYSIPIALKTVTIDAYNADGVDTGTARLGLTTQFALSVSGPGSATCTWSVQGGGTISSSGLYQAPTTMPSSSTVKVTGTLTSNTAASATYTMTLLSPAPAIDQTVPASLPPDRQTNLTVKGLGFTPGTTIIVNGSAVQTTYQSPTAVQIAYTPPSGAIWVSLSAHNPNPGAAQSGNYWVPVTWGRYATAAVNTTPGRWIPADFLGLSHEWGDAENMLGSSQIGTNNIYRQLLSNLMMGSNYPFFIRIGGGSTDVTGEPDSRTIPPFAELANAMGVHFALGLNLGSGDVGLARDQANAYMSQMPSGSVSALEIGNEPDTYVTQGYRSSSYNFAAFQNDFTQWSQNAAPYLKGSTMFMGPAWANLNSLYYDLSGFEQSAGWNVNIVSEHYYPGHQYSGTGFSSDFLLQDSAATQGAAYVANYTSTAHQNGQKFRIGELNSIDQGGVTGISDTFSSALWAVDTMFEFLNAGVDGVNWHDASSCAYCAFTFGKASVGGNGIYTLQKVYPIYYGWLLFQQAAINNGARLLSVNVTANANIKAWGTIDRYGVVRVIVINKDQNFDGAVDISVPGYSGTAQVTRLTADGYQATDGISIGGQTFDGSIDGTLVGDPSNETLNLSSGVYSLPIQPTSAALVTISQ